MDRFIIRTGSGTKRKLQKDEKCETSTSSSVPTHTSETASEAKQSMAGGLGPAQGPQKILAISFNFLHSSAYSASFNEPKIDQFLVNNFAVRSKQY